MEKRIYFVTLFSFYFLSCFSSPPVWIVDRPTSVEYWHGIGFANYSNSNDPKMLAKEYAIHEISSQIKINISSEMDIITSEYNGSIDNVITSVMNSRVDLLLPELEFIDSYRTDDGVYFYAKLNKGKYYRAVEKLRANAEMSALNYVIQSEKNFGKGSFYLIQKAWQEIFPFNDEPIEIKYDNRQYNLSTLIRQKQEEFNERISIIPSLNKNNIRTIIDRNNIIKIIVKDRETGKYLTGIPIKIDHNEKTTTLISDREGMIEYELDNYNEKSTFQVKFLLDHSTLIDDIEGVENILNPNKNIVSLKVNVIPAKVLLNANEKNLNKLMKNSILEPVIKDLLSGYVEFVEKKPDFYVNINSNTTVKTKSAEEGFPFFSYGDASISFKDAIDDNEFFNTSISNIKGGDFGSQRTAGIRAYDKMKPEIVRKLQDSLFEAGE